jgi:hypothetical protein
MRKLFSLRICLRVYRPSGARYNDRYCKKNERSGRFFSNVWGWISSRGPRVCVTVEERLNAAVYRRLLEEVMLPSVLPVCGQNFIFQDVIYLSFILIAQNFRITALFIERG